jgi:hypothetical protein
MASKMDVLAEEAMHVEQELVHFAEKEFPVAVSIVKKMYGTAPVSLAATVLRIIATLSWVIIFLTLCITSYHTDWEQPIVSEVSVLFWAIKVHLLVQTPQILTFHDSARAAHGASLVACTMCLFVGVFAVIHIMEKHGNCGDARDVIWRCYEKDITAMGEVCTQTSIGHCPPPGSSGAQWYNAISTMETATIIIELVFVVCHFIFGQMFMNDFERHHEQKRAHHKKRANMHELVEQKHADESIKENKMHREQLHRRHEGAFSDGYSALQPRTRVSGDSYPVNSQDRSWASGE